MPGPIHVEPFVHLAGLTHDDALVAWGAFAFERSDRPGGGWRIVPDRELPEVLPGRHHGSIGVRSEPYGHAVVEVFRTDTDERVAVAETDRANHVWLRGLEPDTEYRYQVTVDGSPWAAGPRFDWAGEADDGQDLQPSGREYDTRFRTFPAPDQRAPARFAVMGDQGIGIIAGDGHGDRQRRLAAALERAVDHAGVRFVVTTGDNVYVGEEDSVAGTGDTDEDWYFSFYQPYRYSISRVPVFPGIGNHDSSDTEVADNRDELADNLFTDVRFADEVEHHRASLDPGLFYRFRFGADLEFTAIDTTQADELETTYFFEHPRHRRFLEEAFPPADHAADGPRWRIPFTHHPPYCAGPAHGNAPRLIEVLVPLLQRAGVRLMLSGHEHNFQHAHHDGIDYLVTGAAGKLREGRPDRLEEAGTRSWAAEGHLLIVDVDGDELTVHPVTDVDEAGRFTYLEAHTPDGDPVGFPLRIRR